MDQEANEYYTSTSTKENLSSLPNDVTWTSPIETLTSTSKIKANKVELQKCIEKFDLGSTRSYVTEQTNVTSNSKLALNDYYYTELDWELNNAIVRCVKHHLFIMDCCANFKKLYSPIILIKALQISSFLGIAAYGGSVGKNIN